MSGPDLRQEIYRAHLFGFNDRARDWLIRRGVTDRARLATGNIGVAEISIAADGTYQPAPSGRRAFVQPVYAGRPVTVPLPEDDPGPIDLLAWFPARPDRWWLRRSVATVLGEWTVEFAEAYGEPLPIFRTPFAWLRAGGQGAVILHDDARDCLRGLGLVAMGGPRHAAELDRRLTPPAPAPAPVIYVPQDAAT